MKKFRKKENVTSLSYHFLKMSKTPIQFTVKENEPLSIEFKDPTATLVLNKASAKNCNETGVVLKVKFEDYPDEADIDNEKTIKTIEKTLVLAKLTNEEKTIQFLAEKGMKPQLIVEGSGEVIIDGEFKLPPEDLEEEDAFDGEEDDSESDSDSESSESSESSDE